MIEIGGLDALQAKLAAMRAATENLEPALLRAGLVPLKAAMERIDAGGPGWPANQSGTPLLHRTGRLLGSLTAGSAGNISRIEGNSIVVGTNLAYARFLQDGTGIYGPSGQRITAHGKGMAFMLGGRRVFAKSIAGTPPRKYLFIDQQTAGVIAQIFARHVMGTSPPGA